SLLLACAMGLGSPEVMGFGPYKGLATETPLQLAMF
ncbi:MAG: hypothetical protein AVDCRST_MAG93-6570, partial [uncultured Chloroflexia bacterium]